MIIKEFYLQIKENAIIRKKTIAFFILVAAVIVFWSFVTVPYTGDIQVFMAGENQVKYQNDSGLLALFEAWDMKGIINRAIIYLNYRTTLLFVEYGDVYSFMIVSKIIYGIGAIMILFIAGAVFPGERINKMRFVVISYFSIFATFTASHMQAEMSAILLSLIIFSLLMKSSSRSMILAGILGALLLFTKSILAIMFFSIIACVYLTKKNFDIKKCYLSLISFVVTEALLLLLLFLIYPQDIKEMKNAAEYQSTMLSIGSNISLIAIIEKFVNQYVQSWVAIPVLAVGLFCSVGLLFDWIREKNINKICAILVAWILPIDIIVVSNCYFIYHYFLLVLPSIITIYLYVTGKQTIRIYELVIAMLIAFLGVAVCWGLKEGTRQVAFINYSTVLLLLVHLVLFSLCAYAKSMNNRMVVVFEILLFSITVFFYMNYSSFISPKSRNMIVMTKSSEVLMDNFPADFGKEPVLLLDSGTVTFYKDAKSYSSYFYNLPMQRWTPGKEWDVQKEEYNKFMSYDGKYIVYSKWFNTEKYPEFNEKLEREYVKLDGSGLWPYSATWDVFQLDSVPDMDGVKNTEEMFIYVRRNM